MSDIEKNSKEGELMGKNSEQNEEDYFKVLTQAYAKFYNFDRSFLGRVFWLVERFYCLIKLRPQSETYYRQLVGEAELHSDKYNINYRETVTKYSRLQRFSRVLSYIVKHPFSSVRLISIYRMKKLFSIMMGGDSSFSSAWVEERFPLDRLKTKKPVIFPLDDALDEQRLEFPVFSDVEVSIVIPVYNQYRTTISCLQAVLAHTHDVSYEVIIGDDASSDITSSIESRVANIKVARVKENQGFVKNCNQAVKHAAGRYVVLLNNDTNVQDNWLSALLSVIREDNTVGLVGPKLLFEDGVLQEAGGIIWNDGSGWNYGRGNNPDDPEYNYRREVDYVSGACILFETALWEKLSGFDERFCPAYYEDTDLAFQIREQGYKVIYQPEASVVHFEGVSNGVDLNSGIKKNQQINCEVFFKKWKSVLKSEAYANGTNVFRAKDRAKNKINVVYIDHYVPFYDKDAGSRSTFNYIKSMLAININVKFIGANFFPHEPYTSALQGLGVEVLYGENCARNWKKWFSTNCSQIDVIYMHRPHITEDFIDHISSLKSRPKLIYFGHDLHFLRVERENEIAGNDSGLEISEDWKRRELSIFTKVDKVYYPSHIEVEKVKELSPYTNVSVLPLYRIDSPEPDDYVWANRKDMLFVGGFGHPPNTDAVLWFVNHVMPILAKEAPDILFHIVGSSVPDSIAELASESVILHGFLSDEALATLYSSVKMVVVPLRYGAGVKGKVLEALQAGVPIVTTPIGAEGLPEAEEVMAISDQEDAMAEHILELNNNESFVQQYLSQYPDYIEKNFSQTVVEGVISKDFCRK